MIVAKHRASLSDLASAAYGSQTVLQGGELDVDGMANSSIDKLGTTGNLPLRRAGSVQAGPEGGFCLWGMEKQLPMDRY